MEETPPSSPAPPSVPPPSPEPPRLQLTSFLDGDEETVEIVATAANLVPKVCDILGISHSWSECDENEGGGERNDDPRRNLKRRRSGSRESRERSSTVEELDPVRKKLRADLDTLTVQVRALGALEAAKTRLLETLRRHQEQQNSHRLPDQRDEDGEEGL